MIKKNEPAGTQNRLKFIHQCDLRLELVNCSLKCWTGEWTFGTALKAGERVEKIFREVDDGALMWCADRIACLMWPVQTLGWTFPDMSKKSWGAPLWRSHRAPTLKPAPAWSSLSNYDFPLSIKWSVFPCQTKIWTLTTLRVYKLSK